MVSYNDEPIAVVGIGCRFPGDSTNPSKLWDLLSEPRDVLTKIPVERFNPEGFYHPDGMHHGTTDVQESYLLSDDHRHFDAQFFNINPLEANSMDPQQRLLLETIYESLESAGLPLESLQGSPTGVFVGLMCEEYSNHLLRDPDTTPIYMSTGTARSIMSNRISYFFDWHGPSMTIDTACSSSLVAVHQAVGALHAGESRVAVAAGANLILSPEPYIGESKLKMLSPGSRSRMWDSEADGYARGDGIASVVLKTLSAALEDGDDIECIIRSSGVNQDGRTTGITMPSAGAQASLIQQTYAKVGLDPRKETDRCQYFEAHGTGTPVGDPIEAEAIHTVFFGAGDPKGQSRASQKLYVGSIKTVVGHTEGTAGLAGVIKASLALKNKVIPPNLLFKKLNPKIRPFYSNIEVPVTALPWPAVLRGQPRRASVNSFGFGGTNAHVILESYELPHTKPTKTSSTLSTSMPFVFSAATSQSLAQMLARYSAYLKINTSLSLRDLLYTLHSKRSNLPVRSSVSASTVDQLSSSIDLIVSEKESIGNRMSIMPPSILGIFTGQGAQWANMGRELINGSPYVEKIIGRLDRRLAGLPIDDRPSWTLREELLVEQSQSRLHQAEISQPLCTAVQIILVDLLYEAGLKFKAVVGHSSGEIGAAYAAGYLSACDAIIIAYYRGLYAHLGRATKQGAMLAAGTSPDDAIDLCSFPELEGRICVAACNSSNSVTLSGDADAIEEVKAILEDEGKFARILRVDTAYHSHHMKACSDSYTRALTACNIEVLSPANSACIWYSSVDNIAMNNVRTDLKSAYWNNNMLNPVLYSDAIKTAIANSGPFNLAIEIGPHPTLQGPTLQTFQDVTTDTLPYTGTLKRGGDAMTTLSDALGFVWEHFGSESLQIPHLNDILSGTNEAPMVLKGLPSYSWDHDRVFWFESRSTKMYRTRSTHAHELLGTVCEDSNEDSLRWKNLLRPSEIQWLSGHMLQGQMVFPAAGYVVTAMEAAKELAKGQSIKLLEVRDLTIVKSMTFEEDLGVEILFVLTNIETQDSLATAKFTYHAGLGKSPDTLTLMASGSVQLVFGDSVASLLPPKTYQPSNLVDVDQDLFYESLAQLGYGYSGPFRALFDMKRKLDVGTGLLANPHSLIPGTSLIIHPGLLDATFQSLFLAFCWPGDGSLKELHVPTKIKSIKINPTLCQNLKDEADLPFNCFLMERSRERVSGDVSVYVSGGNDAVLQVQGVEVVPFAPSSPALDRALFSRIDWGLAAVDGELAAADDQPTNEEYQFSSVAEQTALYYMQKLLDEVSDSEWAQSEWHHAHLRHYADDTISKVQNSRVTFWKKEWLDNSKEDIIEMGNRYPNSFELELIRTVGENLPAAVRGERQILEFMMHNSMLQRLYAEGIGLGEQTVFLGRMAKQVVHRYPQTNILEIGAGTGGATKSALKEMNEAFTSYTFTDISPAFFENAQQVFEEYSNRMTFKVLDIEKDVESQGFIPGSYDVIIASLVLHATKNIEITLRNVRRLLKPGGFLLMCELTSPPPLRMGFIFSGLPGWWLGVDDDRTLSPCINPTQWDAVLRKTGFSGVDSMTPEVDFMVRPGFVIASQAVDDRIVALRQPLASPPAVANVPKIIIIGGKESQVVDPVGEIMSPYCNQIHKIDTLEDIEENTVTPLSAILILADLDVPTFQSITKRSLSGIKLLFKKARTVLWVTRGSRAAVPYSNIAVGFGRSLAEELPHVRLQFLDLDHTQAADPKVIAEFLLMGHLLDVWENMRVQGNMLWSKEPEISQHNSRMFVPRLIADKPRNDVYNSGRRLITKEVDPAQFPVQLYRSKASYSIKENLEADLPVDTIFLKVTHSILSPIQVSRTTFLYLVVGTEVKTRKNVLAFSKVNASMVQVPSEWIADCNVPAGQEAQVLRFAGFHLIAQAVVPSDSPSTTFVIHEPEVGMTPILSKIAAERNLKIRFTTHIPENSNLSGPWIFIHPMLTNDDIKQSLPEDISVFLDMTVLTHVRSIIEPCIPSWCRVISLASVFGENARVSGQDPSVRVSKFFAGLSEALISNTKIPVAPVIRVEDVIKVSNLENLTVVDWTESSTLPVPLSPVDSRNLFASNKTYILFGLTSNLGQSLVTWMVQRGARHVVLTSRHPNVDSAWIRSLERIGASIKVFANDITEKLSLQKLCREIRDQWPQVGGIANGAMVLQDTLIRDLDIETLVKVLKPKVDGSGYLDEIFHDDKLEFCVFFSSLAGIYGNRGQSNYSAANAFMAALAAQRRSRGQAASILHLGAVMGAGYVSREGSSALLRSIDRAGWLWLSERDVHQSFAEAIVRGQSDFEDPHKCEVLVGARRVEPEEGLERQWFDNPKFQHCANQHGSVAAKSNDSASTVSLKSQLLIVTTEKEAYEIIKDSFLVKLKVSLQLQDLSGDKQKAILSQGADQLGMDSLIAVEIRSWFLKEYLVDIQVLKILGGATIGEILDLALEKLPQELTPNIRLSDPDKSNPSGRETPASESRVSATNSVTLSIEGKESISAVPTTSSASTTSVDELHFLRTEAMGFGQSRFWSLRNILEDQTTFNIVCSGSLSGPLRISQLEKAVSKVAQVHEVLRTAFFESKDHGYVQGILPQSRIQLEHQSITNEREFSREHDAMRAHVFDLEQGDTFRFKVLSLNSTSHFLIIGYHHIIMDGVSLEVFLSDLAKVYGDQKLESPPQSYCDFSLEERENVTAGRMNTELAYWKDSFSDIPPPLPLLPFSQTRWRQNLSTYNFVKSEVKIDAKLATKIKNVCKEQKVTPFHFYLAAFKSMLFRILDTEEICIGMADANRINSTIISSLGMFMNLLPLIFRTDPSQEFKDALKEARMKAYSALANGNVPFNVLLEILDVPRSASHSPLFQAFINYRQGVQEKRYIGDCEVEGLNYQIARSSYDISLDIIDNPGGDSTISFMLQESLYSQSDSKRILEYFMNIVEGVSSNPSLNIGLIPIFSASSIQEALALGRGPDIDSKWDITLGHQIDSIIKDRESDIALRDEVGKMTFKDMSRRMNQISAALFSCNIQPQSIIGVLQEPTSDWICSLLAIWKLGHIYLPLDTQIPHARLSIMALDCKPAVILFHNPTLQIASSLTRENMKKLNISCLSDEPAPPLTNRATPQSLAAIIYTSGSTGIPKGILLKHSSLVNQMEQYVTDLSITHQVVMQQSAFSFDLSLWEMLMGLTCGGSVYVVPNSKRRDPISITKLITEEGITLTLATPTEYLSWLKYGSSLKSSKLAYALSGGEALTPNIKQAFYNLSKSGLRLFNFYGPAESTISCHTAEIDYTEPVSMTSSNPIPAGFTIRNTSTYILDENLKPLPVGFTGEVAIGGAAVADGYFNNDELNARTFPENPHATSSDLLDKGWKKMLRTGDRGRLREDGALILEGRMSGDTQVKFLGVRIELQDIENTILQAAQPALSEAVVSFCAESNILVAHVVFSAEHPLEDRAGFLKRLLPSLPLAQYMRPAIIIPLESLPITAHSKIDRMLIQKLPIPQVQRSTLAHPLTDTEQQLKEIWESVLAKEVVGFNDFTSDTDFFHAGGNSGILVRVQALVRERFDVVIPLIDFFEASTIGAMASKIEKAVPEGSIDWDEETSVSAISSSSIAAEPLTKTSTSTGKMVLLTGATGFLGRKILETLINDTGISKVCCVLRGENRIPFKSDKLMVYSGNLTAPLLGLHEDTFKTLAQEVDIIIHSGAQRSFWEYYQLLRRANVSSTKELAKMAAARRIPIQYISSGGVLKFDNSAPPTDGSDGYVASKWASEKILEKAAKAFGIPITIHRTLPTAQTSGSSSAILEQFLDLTRQMKVLPFATGWTGEMHLLPLDTVTTAICKMASQEQAAETGPRYIHHHAEVKLPASELSGYLESHIGEKGDFARMPGLEWIGKIKQMGFGYLISSQKMTLEADGKWARDPLISSA